MPFISLVPFRIHYVILSSVKAIKNGQHFKEDYSYLRSRVEKIAKSMVPIECIGLSGNLGLF